MALCAVKPSKLEALESMFREKLNMYAAGSKSGSAGYQIKNTFRSARSAQALLLDPSQVPHQSVRLAESGGGGHRGPAGNRSASSIRRAHTELFFSVLHVALALVIKVFGPRRERSGGYGELLQVPRVHGNRHRRHLRRRPVRKVNP